MHGQQNIKLRGYVYTSIPQKRDASVLGVTKCDLGGGGGETQVYYTFRPLS